MVDYVMAFLNSLSVGFGAYMFDILIWGGIFVATGFFAWRWYYKNKLFKFTFIEVNKNGSNFFVKKARIIKNKKGIRKFMIKDYSDPMYYMSIKEPNGYWNGKPCRFICWDGMGNLTYLDGFRFENDKYLETALTEVERSEAVDGQMESMEKSNSVSKIAKWIMTISVVFVFVSMIIVIMVAKYGFESTSNGVRTAQAMEVVTNNIKEISENQIAYAEAMNNLAGMMATQLNVSINQEIVSR